LGMITHCVINAKRYDPDRASSTTRDGSELTPPQEAGPEDLALSSSALYRLMGPTPIVDRGLERSCSQ
jgi:hypothetical protein